MKQQTIDNVAEQIATALDQLTPWDAKKLKEARRKKFLAFGRAH
jgi:acetyl-CoA carboxylase alpha subunit